MCLQLFPQLRAHVHSNWRNLVTGDESWFYHEYVRDRISTAWDENGPEIANRTIASTRNMLTVLWNPHGFHVITFFDQNLVPLIDKFFPLGWNPVQRKLAVHIDNAPVHNSKMTQDIFENGPLKRIPHPPYSPDISPSDFYFSESEKGPDRPRDSRRNGTS
jgi:histone-lysine N-methyltransferase SETMAR